MMTYMNSTFQTQSMLNNAVLVRIGQREISVGRDFRKRFYQTNPIVECRAGVNAGHVEILILRSWLVVLSKAQH
jgi:hypothetical protein